MPARSEPAAERWLVVSNCQTHGFANSLQALAPDVEVVPLYPHSFNRRPIAMNRMLSGFDRLFISPGIEKLMPRARLDRIASHTLLPWFNFRAYHPDLIYVDALGERLKGPADDYHSGIALAAYRRGMSLSDTRDLFRFRVFDQCGFLDWWAPERDRVIEHVASIGIDISRQIRVWGRQEPFMYSSNHPKIRVLFDLAVELVRATGREPRAGVTLPHDNLAFASGFAVYPEIADALGVAGGYIFKTFDTYRQFGLDEFLSGCFAAYDRYPQDLLETPSEFANVMNRIEQVI